MSAADEKKRQLPNPCPSYVTYRKSKIQFQSGTYVVGPNLPGPNCGINQVLRARIAFPKGFCCTPIVTVNTLADPEFESAGDTFAVSLTHVDRCGFNVNIRRVDTNDTSQTVSPPAYTWAQNLQVSYNAIARVPECVEDCDDACPVEVLAKPVEASSSSSALKAVEKPKVGSSGKKSAK